MMFLIILVFVIALLIFYSTGRKSSLKNTAKEPVEYAPLLNSEISFYRNLDTGKKESFEKRIKEFLDYVNIEGVGTEITDLDRVLIASSAIIPVFGFEDWKYKNLTNVILYPDTFDEKFQFEGDSRNIMGMVGTGYMNGQMILSRASLYKGFSKSSGRENVGIHEFVHLLDKSDGITDGIPETFIPHEYALPWLKMMHQEIHRIEAGKSDINPYASTNEAEFLAVASEYFFSKPEEFESKHPELYTQMRMIFGLS
jgi:Mlc titration factor MtfA (ptsG expression regulator)